MNKHRHTKLIHEGHFAAEGDVKLIDSDEGRSPPDTGLVCSKIGASGKSNWIHKSFLQ